MIKSEYKVIGVMSGTSLDGIDLAYSSFIFKDDKWHFDIIYANTISYDEKWVERLKSLVHLSKKELLKIDHEYTKLLGNSISEFIKNKNISQLDAICSHGHTALHQPDNGLTYQIGNIAELGDMLEPPIVCDFRVQDVELKGQGAPLVPIGDQLLFSDYNYCLNLGGFANVSTQKNNFRIAYDICPVNIVLNHYMAKLGLPYDDKGKLAKSGQIHEGLLAVLNGLDYYKLKAPKSLGLEWVIKAVIPLIDSYKLEIKDVLATVVEHIAIQISLETNRTSKARILVTGGGVYNTFLMDRIAACTNHEIVVPEPEIVEFKEALIFGFLGVLKLRNEVNCLRSVTGAIHDHSSGRIIRA